MLYHIEKKEVVISIDKLLKHYNLKEVEGYCSVCPSYNKIWSCPPHDFNPFEYLNKYRNVYIISGKVILNKEEFKTDFKDQVNEVFQEARRAFSDELMMMEMEYKNSQALIAGNCYQCEVCTKEDNKPCIHFNKMRYSLEALGLLVSTITSEILEQEIIWIEDEIPDYLLMVGGLLVK